MIHISFDDIYKCLLNLEKDRPGSLFDEPFLGTLKVWHDTYQAVFTLNCFNRESKHPEYAIEKLPVEYGRELRENADWLKFSFHAQDDLTNYGGGRDGSSTSGVITGDCVDQISADYKLFADTMLRVAGTEAVIDRVVRLGFFGGTKANVEALTHLPYGIKGLLTADDDRLSYYFNAETVSGLGCNPQYREPELGLPAIVSLKRLEKIENIDLYIEALNRFCHKDNVMIELFTHEQKFDVVKNDMEQIIKWAHAKKIVFGFAQDVI